MHKIAAHYPYTVLFRCNVLEFPQTLIEAGLGLNPVDNTGETPLGIASYKGRLEVVRSLVEAGADMCHESNNSKMESSDSAESNTQLFFGT